MGKNIKIKKIHEKATIPALATPGAAGYDVTSVEEHTIFPGETAAISTGLKFEIPHGYEVQVRPRSGLALKNGITVLNSPGTIDSDYRGEVKVILHNLGKMPFLVEVGMRVAQLVVAKLSLDVVLEETHELNNTERGEGGFGSSGLK